MRIYKKDGICHHVLIMSILIYADAVMENDFFVKYLIDGINSLIQIMPVLTNKIYA